MHRLILESASHSSVSLTNVKSSNICTCKQSTFTYQQHHQGNSSCLSVHAFRAKNRLYPSKAACLFYSLLFRSNFFCQSKCPQNVKRRLTLSFISERAVLRIVTSRIRSFARGDKASHEPWPLEIVRVTWLPGTSHPIKRCRKFSGVAFSPSTFSRESPASTALLV